MPREEPVMNQVCFVFSVVFPVMHLVQHRFVNSAMRLR